MSLVLIGSGPGIGLAVARLFATKRYSKIALLARNQERLVEARAAIISTASRVRPDLDVRTYAVDISDAQALEKVLRETEKDLGPPECVYFNAARVAPGSFFDTTVEEMESDFKVRAAHVFCLPIRYRTDD
jgi:NAD(P)-dependent dehydrogenase (short-subunit alcohol dehydrogenase family)